MVLEVGTIRSYNKGTRRTTAKGLVLETATLSEGTTRSRKVASLAHAGTTGYQHDSVRIFQGFQTGSTRVCIRVQKMDSCENFEFRGLGRVFQ